MGESTGGITRESTCVISIFIVCWVIITEKYLYPGIRMRKTYSRKLTVLFWHLFTFFNMSVYSQTCMKEPALILSKNHVFAVIEQAVLYCTDILSKHKAYL